MIPALALLVPALHDAWSRRVCWHCIGIAGTVTAVAWWWGAPLSLWGAVAGYVTARAGQLPGGDQQAMALAGLVSGPLAVLLAGAGLYLGLGALYVLIDGGRRDVDLVALPLLPFFAAILGHLVNAGW